MKDSTIAARYARALFILTERRNESAASLDDLRGLHDVLARGSQVGLLLDTPQVPLSDKRAVLRKVLEGRTLPSTVLFLDLLLRKHRLREFEAIVIEFEALMEHKLGIRRANVTRDKGWVVLELEGTQESIDSAIASVSALGVRVDPIEGDVIEG